MFLHVGNDMTWGSDMFGNTAEPKLWLQVMQVKVSQAGKDPKAH